MKRLYIAGPMSRIKDYNYPAFREAAAELRAAGFDVVNPVEVGAHLPYGSPWHEYMRVCIPALMTCHAVATLPGWTTSEGAEIEVYLAHKLAMEVRSVKRWMGKVPVQV